MKVEINKMDCIMLNGVSFAVTVATSGPSGSFTLMLTPHSIDKEMNWKPGEQIKVNLLKPATLIDQSENKKQE